MCVWLSKDLQLFQQLQQVKLLLLIIIMYHIWHCGGECRLRNLGSAALHMCLVAAGQLDAHVTFGIHIWDMAAGDLIVREAGGIVCDTSGNDSAF